MTRSRNFVGLAALSAVSLTLSGCEIGGEDEEPQASLSGVEMALPDLPIKSAKGDTVTAELPVKQGLIYVVDIKSNGNSMTIGFPYNYRTSYSGDDFAAHRSDFENAMVVAFNNQGPLPGWNKTKTKSKRCRMKGGNVNGNNALQKCPEADADLSISNSKISFIGFVLKKKSATVDQSEKITWRFVEERTDTGDQYQDDHIIKRHVSAGDNYSYLRKLDKDGVFKDGEVTQTNVVGGYFVANGTTAVGGDDTPTSTAKYQDRFNLYTEIHSTDGTNTEIPVIIDPDVRWPGGDGP